MSWRRGDDPWTWLRGGEVKDDERFSDFSESDHPAWVRLKEMYKRGDFEKLDSAVAFVDFINKLGKAGSLLKAIVIFLTIMMGAYIAFTEFLVRYIRKAAGT